MAKILKIYTVEDTKEEKFLREKTREVTTEEIESKSFQSFLDDLIFTAQNYESEDGYLSVGLAAVQVGKKYKTFTFFRQVREKFEIMINPEIDILTPLQDIEKEGCLSIPNIEGNVARFKKIRVKYLDKHGKKRKEIFNGMDAREIQHEYDHTQGVLFTDKIID